MKVKDVFTTKLGYKYITCYAGPHGRTQYNIYFHNNALNVIENNRIKFPLRGYECISTVGHKNYIIRKNDNINVYYIEIVSGFRGDASITSIDNGDVVIKDVTYHSPLGNLGCTSFAIVNSPHDNVIVYGRKTGRRIDNTTVHERWMLDGSIISCDEEHIAKLLTS